MNKRILHWITCQIKSISSLVKTLTNRVDTIEENCCNGGSEQNPSYITGYFSDGVFYTDNSQTEEITPIEDSIFIDQETGDSYYFDGNEYKVFSYSEDPAIVFIDEGGSIGYGTQYRRDNPNFYGDIGFNAVDLSYSEEEGNFGAIAAFSHAEGINTEAKSFVEHARGSLNYSPTPISPNTWEENDLIESVGGGTSTTDRKNLFARYKNGAFYWIKKQLSTITNAVKGFHAADEEGRLNYFDGTKWIKYELESKVLTSQNTTIHFKNDVDYGTENSPLNTINFDFSNAKKDVIQCVYYNSQELPTGIDWLNTSNEIFVPNTTFYLVLKWDGNTKVLGNLMTV